MDSSQHSGLTFSGISYCHQQQALVDKNGKIIALRPQSLKVFQLLADSHDRVISKEDIFLSVWKDAVVTDDSLIQCVADIRRALQDKKHVILKTIPRKGYQLIADIPTPSVIDSALSADIVPLVGRTKELEELTTMLSEPDCRLLTLLGIGGIGKSRLAKRIAQQLQQNKHFQQGVYFVPLAHLQHTDLVPEAIAHAIGLSLQGAHAPAEQLISHLQQHEILLILDNIEHLLPDVQICLTLLKHIPRLKIMVTSRLPLALYGEWQYALKGLNTATDQDVLTTSEAHCFFVQSARRMNYAFQPNAQDSHTILEICRLVEGMPLAIEIAASWLQHLSCEEVLTEMHHHLAEINHSEDSDTPFSALNRVLQQTWHLLTEREQLIMQTLALFRGRFSREAASAIGDIRLTDYSGLISKSMLMRNECGRYSLHEVMRQYSREQMINTHYQHSLTYDFINYYIELAQQADSAILGGEQLRYLTQLEHEHANLRECLSLCKTEKPHSSHLMTLGMKLSGTLSMFWFLSNHWQEGQEWAEYFLTITPQTQSPKSYAAASLSSGGLSILLDDYGLAEKRLTLAIKMFEQDTNHSKQARGLTIFSALRRLQGNYAEAIEFGKKSSALFEVAEDEGGYQFNLGNLGHSLLGMGCYEEAMEALEACIHFNRRTGVTVTMPYVLVNLGRVHYKQKQYAFAHDYLQQAIELSEHLGILLYHAQALAIRGWIEIMQGNTTQAQCYFYESALDYLQLGDQRGLAYVMKGMAVVKAAINELAQALQYMTSADVLIKDNHAFIAFDREHQQLLDETLKRIQCGLTTSEQTFHRNIGLLSHPKALFVNV